MGIEGSMATLDPNSPVHICIPEAVNQSNVTLYVVSMRIGSVEWRVKRRYKEFAQLHESLLEAGVDKDSLPEKKLLGHRDAAFIMKRRRDLESYLQSVFHFLKYSLPDSLSTFLHMDQYETLQLLRSLAASHFDAIGRDVENTHADFTPLQMHAISQRFQSPRPAHDTQDRRYDFANVADFACQLKSLTVEGSEDPYLESNIVPNSLPFHFLAFKNLVSLSLVHVDCRPDKLSFLAPLRETVETLLIQRCGLSKPGDFLLCDLDGGATEATDSNAVRHHHRYIWKKLKRLDMSDNAIESLDASFQFTPKVEALILSRNRIACLDHLSCLPELSFLDVSDNALVDSSVHALHTRLGQVCVLDLSHNKIAHLDGCAKLYSLQQLNVSCNRIRDLDGVVPVTQLPCLESLNLQGNPATMLVDYRLKVLERFGKRCSDLCLDNECPTQSEVDKVSVLMALRVAREGRSPTSLFGNLPRPV